MMCRISGSWTPLAHPRSISRVTHYAVRPSREPWKQKVSPLTPDSALPYPSESSDAHSESGTREGVVDGRGSGGRHPHGSVVSQWVRSDSGRPDSGRGTGCTVSTSRGGGGGSRGDSSGSAVGGVGTRGGFRRRASSGSSSTSTGVPDPTSVHTHPPYPMFPPDPTPTPTVLPDPTPTPTVSPDPVPTPTLPPDPVPTSTVSPNPVSGR